MNHSEQKIDSKAAAQTGIGPTTVIAIEQCFPVEQRLIEDDLAANILPAGYRFLVKLMRIPFLRNWMVKATDKQLHGVWQGMIVRKRYIDEQLVAAVAASAVEAIVNLGAGYDTRVYRLPELTTIPVWEVDQPVNINAKRKGLQHALGGVPAHVTLVPINFIEETLGDVLQSHGYVGNRKTFFIWEAVSQYLSETAVRQTFQFLAQAPTGSRLTFTYVLKDFIAGENMYGAEKFYEQMVVKNNAWHFGFLPEELPDFLRNYGWRLREDVDYAELAQRYVKPTGRDLPSVRNLPSMAIERMVDAEKM